MTLSLLLTFRHRRRWMGKAIMFSNVTASLKHCIQRWMKWVMGATFIIDIFQHLLLLLLLHNGSLTFFLRPFIHFYWMNCLVIYTCSNRAFSSFKPNSISGRAAIRTNRIWQIIFHSYDSCARRPNAKLFSRNYFLFLSSHDRNSFIANSVAPNAVCRRINNNNNLCSAARQLGPVPYSN